MANELTFSHDRERDTLTVDGIPFSGEFFRVIADADPNTLYQIVKSPDGVIRFDEVNVPQTI